MQEMALQTFENSKMFIGGVGGGGGAAPGHPYLVLSQISLCLPELLSVYTLSDG